MRHIKRDEDVELRRVPVAWDNLEVRCRCGRACWLRVDMPGMQSYRCACGLTHRIESARDPHYVMYGPPGSEL